MHIYPEPELTRLAEFSARLGHDPALVQGAGGNTSLKTDAVLWIKASGLWLADALEKPIFSAVPWSALADALRTAMDGQAIDAAIKAAVTTGLRPSIETSLHALMPHRVVVHVHAVDALADLVRTDGARRVAEALRDLAWCWIPYRRPGAPLTVEVRDQLKASPVDILLLANHGLVVGAASVVEVELRLVQVLAALGKAVRPGREAVPDKRMVAKLDALGYRPVTSPQTHMLATDPVSFAHAQRGVFYPDQAVFLGPEILCCMRGTEPADALARFEKRYGQASVCLVLEDAGVFVATSAKVDVEVLLHGHALFLARLPAEADIVTLAPEDVAALLSWDAEVYRQTLAARS